LQKYTRRKSGADHNRRKRIWSILADEVEG
jgi:hypothetical protein